jgi:hypothetical protein
MMPSDEARALELEAQFDADNIEGAEPSVGFVYDETDPVSLAVGGCVCTLVLASREQQVNVVRRSDLLRALCGS